MMNQFTDLERRHAGARRRIPQLDGLIVGPGREALRVRREGHRSDFAAMALERRHAEARCHIPQLDGLINGPGREAP